MSAWLLALRELAERGPIPREKVMHQPAPSDWHLLQSWGLAYTDGERGRPGAWQTTALGRMVATQRMEPVPAPKPKGSRHAYKRRRFRATWLRALPDTNEIRINQ